MSKSSPDRGWDITEAQREIYRQRSKASSRAKKQALNGKGQKPIHPINIPNFKPEKLMPQMPKNGWRSLSLFSGCGGLDLGLERAGFTHIASYDILTEAGNTLHNLRPNWQIFSGETGDVKKVNWRPYCGLVDLLHGGPPCQPFSIAGFQKGKEDNRDMFPEFIRAVLEIEPRIFVAENVTALASKKFSKYVEEVIISPLHSQYKIHKIILNAPDFGIPQIRKRVFFIGFRDAKYFAKYQPPQPTHYWHYLPTNQSTEPVQLNLFDNLKFTEKLQRCMGSREALGLPNIGFDALSPTLRSALTGPRHTTSILSSVSAQKTWEKLEIWPNGVAETREKAHLFVAKNGHFRLSISDCGILQGFPEFWQISGPVYMALGQIGNAVPPPMAYQIGVSIARVFS